MRAIICFILAMFLNPLGAGVMLDAIRINSLCLGGISLTLLVMGFICGSIVVDSLLKRSRK